MHFQMSQSSPSSTLALLKYLKRLFNEVQTIFKDNFLSLTSFELFFAMTDDTVRRYNYFPPLLAYTKGIEEKQKLIIC